MPNEATSASMTCGLTSSSFTKVLVFRTEIYALYAVFRDSTHSSANCPLERVRQSLFQVYLCGKLSRDALARSFQMSPPEKIQSDSLAETCLVVITKSRKNAALFQNSHSIFRHIPGMRDAY